MTTDRRPGPHDKLSQIDERDESVADREKSDHTGPDRRALMRSIVAVGTLAAAGCQELAEEPDDATEPDDTAEDGGFGRSFGRSFGQ